MWDARNDDLFAAACAVQMILFKPGSAPDRRLVGLAPGIQPRRGFSVPGRAACRQGSLGLGVEPGPPGLYSR